MFEKATETCRRSHGDCSEAQDTTEKPSDDKQGLFVEFIQFLIKIGMFNKNVVKSMLTNKEIFM